MTGVLGPTVPKELRAVLGEVLEAVKAAAAPQAPTALFSCAAATLPPASAWPSSLVLVSDLNILAHSDGVHWIRQDTGGAI